MSTTLTAIITAEDGGFVALNPETDVASQGNTINDALDNLKEALELYFEESSMKPINIKIQNTFLTTVTF